MQEISAKIDRLPLLPIMPVDAIKVGLAKVGISIKEISGRTYQLDPIDPDNITGLARVSKRSKKKTDIMQAVAEFNSGDCVALIIKGDRKRVELGKSG